MSTPAPATSRGPEPALAQATGGLVALCGLCGGAGTTRLATLLAAAAAQQHPTDYVALIETDPAGGGLAHATGATSPHGLSDHARNQTTQQPPGALQFAAGPGGTRVIASAPAARSPAALEHVTALLHDIRTQHHLVIVDGGTLREPHAQPALLAATHVIWVMAAAADPSGARSLLASPLSRAAAAARQSILINRVRRDKPRPLREHRDLAHTAGQLILTPQLTDPDTETYAAQCLLAAIT